jgi:hypothetical protein
MKNNNFNLLLNVSGAVILGIIVLATGLEPYSEDLESHPKAWYKWYREESQTTPPYEALPTEPSFEENIARMENARRREFEEFYAPENRANVAQSYNENIARRRAEWEAEENARKGAAKRASRERQLADTSAIVSEIEGDAKDIDAAFSRDNGMVWQEYLYLTGKKENAWVEYKELGGK